MKKILFSAIAAGLMLSACASKKPADAPQAPQISVEEALQQCQQAGGANQDRATFDACMKDKGFERRTAAAPAPEQAAPAPAPEEQAAPAPAKATKKRK